MYYIHDENFTYILIDDGMINISKVKYKKRMSFNVVFILMWRHLLVLYQYTFSCDTSLVSFPLAFSHMLTSGLIISLFITVSAANTHIHTSQCSIPGIYLWQYRRTKYDLSISHYFISRCKMLLIWLFPTFSFILSSLLILVHASVSDENNSCLITFTHVKKWRNSGSD